MRTDKCISLRLAERRAKSLGRAHERIRSCSAALETPPRHGGQGERTVWTSLLKLTTCFLKNTTGRCKHPPTGPSVRLRDGRGLQVQGRTSLTSAPLFVGRLDAAQFEAR